MEEWITNDHEETFWGHRNIDLLIAVMILQVCPCVKIHQLCTLIYEVYYMSIITQ